MSRHCRRHAMTAIEVLVSTILAALLMSALLGVIRGLKAHERSLGLRTDQPTWSRSLDEALTDDFGRASTYELAPGRLTLHGFLGRTADGSPDWRPSTVVYEIRATEQESWIVRKDLPPHASPSTNLVLADVKEIRVGETSASSNPTVKSNLPPDQVTREPQPVRLGVQVELWSSDKEVPRYEYIFPGA